MSRRTRTELVYQVLESIESGIHKPTNILFNARLNWRNYKNIIEMLMENNYVVKNESDDPSSRNKVQYYLSEDGKEALQGMRYLRKVFA